MKCCSDGSNKERKNKAVAVGGGEVGGGSGGQHFHLITVGLVGNLVFLKGVVRMNAETEEENED